MAKDLKEVPLYTWDDVLKQYIQNGTVMADGITALYSNGVGSYSFNFNTIHDVKINFNGLQ